MERFDKIGVEDREYRKLTVAVRRALRQLLPLLDKLALARYVAVEQAVNARDVYSTDAVAQWAYSLGYRDGASPMPKLRVRKRTIARLTRLRRGSKG